MIRDVLVYPAQRARDILRSVLTLQDQDPDSKTYGLWPWYLEEPLDKMPFPDWDTAAVCAAPLLMVWITSRQRLEAPLQTSLGAAVVHAARSIQQRDVESGGEPEIRDAAGSQPCRTDRERRYLTPRFRAFFDGAAAAARLLAYGGRTEARGNHRLR